MQEVHKKQQVWPVEQGNYEWKRWKWRIRKAYLVWHCEEEMTTFDGYNFFFWEFVIGRTIYNFFVQGKTLTAISKLPVKLNILKPTAHVMHQQFNIQQ